MTTNIAKELLSTNLVYELRQSYLDYAMSVIIGRALPDIRDGLKPVHRRVLYSMFELNNDWNKPYKKSARVVGDVIGKYHPHGEAAVYAAIVRMAQDFSMRYMLIDGQGNFGSVDGDAPAAMRYTEVRMSRLTQQLLVDLDRDTVDFLPNYDESEKEPTVLPARIPNLLINGSSGIAVGMATNIPPHNLREVINATLHLLQNPQAEVGELIAHVPAPDFPTAGIICGRHGIEQAYRTGRGRVIMRGRCEVEYGEKRDRILITELPYVVNKARLLEKIAGLVKEKQIDSIAEIRDESDKDGMRVVIDLKQGRDGHQLLNKLYRNTDLQSSFGINMVALDHGKPIVANLKEVLTAFIRHRRDVVTRRCIFELRKIRDRAHVLEGQAVALANIDDVVALIRQSSTPAEAKSKLMQTGWQPGLVTTMLANAGAQYSDSSPGAERALTCPDGLPAGLGLQGGVYYLSEMQAQAILDLRLHRLTALEQNKIVDEYGEAVKRIIRLLAILSNPDELLAVIRTELDEIRDRYSDDRRTEIQESSGDLSDEDLIAKEDVIATFSHTGYAKIQSPDSYVVQHRGGRGKTATKVKDEDFIDQVLVVSTHDTLLCFSSLGRLYWLKAYQLQQAGRLSKGRPLVNLLNMQTKEKISAVLPIKDFSQHHNVVIATANGIIKKTALHQFSRPRSKGINAIRLRPDDELIGAQLTDGEYRIMVFSDQGKGICFHERDLRATGRGSIGVRALHLRDGARAKSMLVYHPEKEQRKVLIACLNGYGKRTEPDKFKLQRRGGQGRIAIRTSDRNGALLDAILVADDDDIMLVTVSGMLVRTRSEDISVVGRATQGVRLIRLKEGDRLTKIVAIAKAKQEGDEQPSSSDDVADSAAPTESHHGNGADHATNGNETNSSDD